MGRSEQGGRKNYDEEKVLELTVSQAKMKRKEAKVEMEKKL